MPRLVYESKRFGASIRHMIGLVNRLLDTYAEQGYNLTLRQAYYQLVSRDWFPDDRTFSYDLTTKRWYRDPNGTKNAEPNYKWLGGIINDARLAGYIDWERIVDRGRNLQTVTHWDSPAEIVAATARSFRTSLWDDQPNYVEAWIEKEALIDVIARPCIELDVPHFACKGYTSQSEMWSAGQRLLAKRLDGKKVTILHLGDHDPSGIDMTRDTEDRLRQFVGFDYVRAQAEDEGIVLGDGGDHKQFIGSQYAEAVDGLEIRRIALNMDQVDRYGPPPNPAKMTDSRYEGYIRDHGYESWELDALEPALLDALVREHIEDLVDDQDAWEAALDRQNEGQKLLGEASRQWSDIAKRLNGKGD